MSYKEVLVDLAKKNIEKEKVPREHNFLTCVCLFQWTPHRLGKESPWSRWWMSTITRPSSPLSTRRSCARALDQARYHNLLLPSCSYLSRCFMSMRHRLLKQLLVWRSLTDSLIYRWHFQSWPATTFLSVGVRLCWPEGTANTRDSALKSSRLMN